MILDVPFNAAALSRRRKAQRTTYRFAAVAFGALTLFLLVATIGLLATVWSEPAAAVVLGLVMLALLTLSVGGVVVGLRGDGRPADWAEAWATPPVAIRVTTRGLWLAGGDPLAGTTYTWDTLQGLRFWTGARGTACLTVTPGPGCTLGVNEPADPVCRMSRLTGSTGIEVMPETLVVSLHELDLAVQHASGGRHRISYQ